MDQTEHLLQQLQEAGIRLNLEKGDKLSLVFDKGTKVPEALLQQVKAHKTNLIVYLSNLNSRTSCDQIPKLPEQESYVMSNSQMRLWIRSRHPDAGVAYNVPAQFELKGGHDTAVLKRSLDLVIARHEILRTTFKKDEEGEIKQWITAPKDFQYEITEKDFSKSPTPLDQMHAYLSQDIAKPFDLVKGPLFRIALFQVATDHLIIYVNMYHIISDGWSMDVLKRDLFEYYEALMSNRAASLPDLRIQYKDYAAWQQGLLQEDSIKKSRKYWLNKLSGKISLLDFGSGQARPKMKQSAGNHLITLIDKKVHNDLERYCQDRGASLFIGLMAVLKILTNRYTGQQDILVGTPLAGRNHVDLENQIGFYVNTLVIRSNIDTRASFEQLLAYEKASIIEAFEHQDMPFDALVNELALNRDTSRNPLFDLTMTLRQSSVSQFSDDLKAGQVVNRGDCVSRYDLDITFEKVGDRLVLEVKFDKHILNLELIQSFTHHFAHLAHHLLKNHTSPVAQIDLLSAAEKAILISDFNPISQALDPDSNLISLFEEQADQMPDELAISFLSKHTTYRQLRQRTNQFAHFLLNKKGVLPGDRVAISCELSDWVLVTMMAILKAGAAFVPIDPEAPDARKQFLQQDSDVVLVVDDVFLMEAIMELSNFPDTNPEVKIDAEELAYIIYTSGTTGQAKGVMIPHRSIYNSMLWQKNETKMDSGDVMLQLMNYSFDGFILVAFLPLISGGALLIADQDTRKDPEKIAQLIESNYITNLYTIPVQFSSIIDSLKEPDKVQLKRSVFCGDKLDGKMISRCKDILPNVEFFNAYGPTENAIVSTMSQRITEDGYFGIGTPIDNTNVFIVNEELMLQPLGVVGEIGLSGLSLAKGYLNQDELTQEKFVPNPYIPGTRLYLTGDLGRWRSDGRLEFVGRKDDQVKVGGQRVELQELKHHLNAYDQIIESVVLARKVAGEITLVAFYRSKKAISSAELRRFLGNRIPQYMIPAHFRLVKEFPMTQNSKLDTAKLLAMDLKPIDDRVPPKNPLERQLLSIWSDLLEVPPEVIGVNHNFFQIGGNSMKLVKMHQQIMDVLKADIPVSAFFEFTTIESLSHYIQNVQTTGEHPSGEIDDQVKEADEMLKLLNRDDV